MNSTGFEYAVVSLNDTSILDNVLGNLHVSIQHTTTPVLESYFQGKSDDELLTEALWEDYENLCST